MESEHLHLLPGLHHMDSFYALVATVHAVSAAIREDPPCPFFSEHCMGRTDQRHKGINDRVSLRPSDRDFP